MAYVLTYGFIFCTKDPLPTGLHLLLAIEFFLIEIKVFPL
jgi:hypothetical protein